ncbi:MAG: hypothetical protein DME49_00530 [Verrucomicrobia bacterium]|nr:MAG: hypothetical protein DME49_00530 [Verrucomicrobiota bacterium]PYK94214.1 MAG: hypothetical protein DME36_06595 [Verrucomicrobiota bacterium]PYL38580.1 MAG: hypothetical protein DMF34_06360 [Verrucomicrobiota bacterium]
MTRAANFLIEVETRVMNHEPSFAVVVPFFNEERNVRAVCGELRGILETMLPGGEVILVDDGSTDKTWAKLEEIALTWPQCRVFHLSENQGQSAALLLGFDKSVAPILVTMDGDGQSDPRDIEKLLVKLEGVDMVVGARVVRQDSWLRRKISWIANSIRSELLGDGVSDAGCALKVFRRDVVGAFIPIRTLYSFMPALAVAAGFRVIEEPVNHRPRKNGTSKYTVRSFLLLPILDFIGLEWFRTRRCPGRAMRSLDEHLAIETLGEELYRRAVRRWLRIVGWAAAICLIGFGLMLAPRKQGEGRTTQKISLHRAERIALHDFPKGRLGSVQLSMRDDRLTWTIDVQPPASADLREIEIDAADGHVIAARVETAEEEALEAAVEDQHGHPRRLVPQ